jgi:hypothetical protein
VIGVRAEHLAPVAGQPGLHHAVHDRGGDQRQQRDPGDGEHHLRGLRDRAVVWLHIGRADHGQQDRVDRLPDAMHVGVPGHDGAGGNRDHQRDQQGDHQVAGHSEPHGPA